MGFFKKKDKDVPAAKAEDDTNGAIVSDIEELKSMVIPGIPYNETPMKEGILRTMRRNFNRMFVTVPYKYVITEKGIWTISNRARSFKSATGFTSFSALSSFETRRHGDNDACIFNPKKGKVFNLVFFDDHEGAVLLLGKYLRRV
jgi:hypothetical protein